MEHAKTRFAAAIKDQESETPKLNFDRLAHLYRWMEWLSFGPYLSRCRFAFLPEFRDAQRALVLGDGDGRFTGALLKRNPAVRVDAIDVSEAMLQSVKRRAGAHAPRVRTERRDVRTWSPREGAQYDLVVTHFFLDCLTTGDVRELSERLQPCLRPGAYWVISEFAIPDSVFGRWAARPVVAFLYWAFGVLTGLQVKRLPEWQSALQAVGLQRVKERRFLRGLLTSQLWVLQPSANRDGLTEFGVNQRKLQTC